jgi:hypothetical protein
MVRFCPLALLLLVACERTSVLPGSPPAAPAPSVSHAAPAPAPPASVSAAAPADPAPAYAWLAQTAYDGPVPVDSLFARFSAPEGTARASLDPKSFGAFLRHLPLAAAGTAVKSYAGGELHPATDPRIAAVIAIDVGHADLQQCADGVIRLHAEWLWSLGRKDQSYRAASGVPLPFARYAAGERVVADGPRLRWEPTGRRADGYASFRSYLDTVFAWANTVSLERQAAKVDAADLRAGDFFVAPGNPGHSVLVLDLASAPGGRRFALLGQSYMPAQNLQVLRPQSGAVWFEIDPAHEVDTPFWAPFPWTSLRRLPD